MEVVIKSAVIVAKDSKHNGKKRDILIRNGKIVEIKASISSEAKKISFPNLHVSLGWVDMCAHFNDPGTEYNEDIHSGLDAAARGGFTEVVISPNTLPPISNKASVEYALRKAEGKATKLHVMGALSANIQGKQIAEYFDMTQAGAIAFSDDKTPVDNAELMHRALDYAKNYDSLIVSFPFDNHLCPHGQMNEGITSVTMGLKGMPNITEEIRLQRDIELLRYTESKMHVMTVSTARSVDMIRQAKKEGLNISCSIAAHQISFLDEDLIGFDTRFKVNPPFRTKEDRKAIIKGLKDGTIDAIISDHRPLDVEHKKKEFERASYGISGIETAFGAINRQINGKISLEDAIEKLTVNPRVILGVDQPTFENNSLANLTLFDPDCASDFKLDAMVSRSKNSPFSAADLLGKVYGVVRGKRVEVVS